MTSEQTLLTFRSLYSNTYWGFEPNPSCVFYLNSLIKTNKFKNVNILPIGLSSENALLKFYLKNEVDSAGTIIQELRPDYYDSEEVNFVPLFSFDNLNFNEIKNISLIKIDVEGAELDVISGLIKTINKLEVGDQIYSINDKKINKDGYIFFSEINMYVSLNTYLWFSTILENIVIIITSCSTPPKYNNFD